MAYESHLNKEEGEDCSISGLRLVLLQQPREPCRYPRAWAPLRQTYPQALRQASSGPYETVKVRDSGEGRV